MGYFTPDTVSNYITECFAKGICFFLHVGRYWHSLISIGELGAQSLIEVDVCKRCNRRKKRDTIPKSSPFLVFRIPDDGQSRETQ
jgi:hypothetical protein